MYFRHAGGLRTASPRLFPGWQQCGHSSDFGQSAETLRQQHATCEHTESHEWFAGAEGGDFRAAAGRLRGENRQVYNEMMSTGAVVSRTRDVRVSRSALMAGLLDELEIYLTPVH
jgi:hypothetical protein